MFWMKPAALGLSIAAALTVGAIVVGVCGAPSVYAQTKSLPTGSSPSNAISSAERQVEQIRAELAAKQKQLDEAQASLDRLRAENPNAPFAPPDRIEFRYADTGGWASNYRTRPVGNRHRKRVVPQSW